MSTRSPIRQVLWPVCFISAPALEYSCINGFVDRGCHRVTGVQRLNSDGPIVVFSKGQYFIDAVCHLSQGVMDGTRIFVAIDYNAILEFESVRDGFAHQPLERDLSEQVVLIAATDISMGSYEPALLDVGQDRAQDTSVPVSECSSPKVLGQTPPGARLLLAHGMHACR